MQQIHHYVCKIILAKALELYMQIINFLVWFVVITVSGTAFLCPGDSVRISKLSTLSFT